MFASSIIRAFGGGYGSSKGERDKCGVNGSVVSSIFFVPHTVLSDGGGFIRWVDPGISCHL